MQKINLIPEVKQQQLKVKKNNLLATTFAVVVGIVLGSIILILLGYIVARKAQISNTDSQKNMLNQQLQAYADLEKTVLSLETGLNDIKAIINNDSKWMDILGDVEKATPVDVRFKSVKITPDYLVTAELQGKNVASIDRFIRSFSNIQSESKQNIFSDVEVNGYTTDGSTVSFSASFKINKDSL